MAKDRRVLQHIHSSIPDKQPTPASLRVGEIAVNNSANKEFLSLKNSNDKVVRFSSDSTIIDWIENKEVIPYKGYVRGETGPSATSGDSPTADAYGSYGITNDDLLNNKSNIIVKINQVAAKKTVKYDKINAAKDRYNKDINPSENTPTGKTDGAGFFIDMSRYAMQGANPEFSGTTNTCYTNLNGTTKIKGVDGTCGSLLEITVNSAKTDVETANTEITSATTVIGTNATTISGNTTLNVSGTTTETKKGQVTENNQSGYTVNTTGNVIVNTTGTTTETKVGNVTENHSGTTTDNNNGNVIVNNQANFNMNTSGNTTITTTGNTVIHSDGAVGITAVEDIVATSSESSIILTANDDLCETAGDVAAIKGVNKTNVGIDCSDAGRTKVTNVYGDTINERANTADTRVTSAYTSATTATTIIGTANTSATTATLSGNTLVVNEATSISAKTPTAYVSGTTLDIKETNTDITSCGRISANTNDFEVKQCAANGKVIINSDDIDISGKTFDVVEATSATIKAPATTISGTSLTLDEGTSISAKTPSTTISGTNFTLSETNTTINSCGKVEITTDSYSLKQCSSSGGSAEFEFCNGYTVKSNAINLQQCGTAGTINITSQTQNINGGTVNITSTNNTNISAKDFCVKGSTSASIGAPTTNIGKACDNSTATTINISGTTINEGGTTNNNNFTTINNTATTINNKANFNITGTTYISGNITISGDVTIGDELIIPIPCDSISSTTVNKALCEIFDRGVVTIEKNTSPTDPQLATIYTIKQNGAVINTIEVAKDQFLQNAEVVKNTSGEWVIRLTWWIYDPDSGTHTTATTDIAASELVKDLTAANPSDNGTALNHNVSVNAWYDSTSGDMKFSAETTQNMHVGNMYITGTTSASTVSGTNVNGGTISGTTVKGVTISGTNITASDAIRANNVSANTISATTFTGAMSKKLTWSGGTFTADTATGYNGSADKVITVPTAISHLPTRGKLTITHNGLSDTYDPASDKPMTLPHSALTWQYGSVTGASSGSYNTSAEKVVTIPKNLKHLTNDLSNLTIAYGSSSNRTGTSTYNGSAAVGTLYIPNTLSNVSNGVVSDSNAASTTAGQVNITKNVSVTGTVTASGAIYSSDRNLKEHIVDIPEQDIDKVGFVSYKTYNFKGEDNKMYGIIAQDLQEVGLGELVYSREDGTLAVDYTSLMILQLARLKRDNEYMLNVIASLTERIEKLEGDKKE